MMAIAAVRFYGLGKLGLPLASLLAASGLRVFGIDTDRGHVEALQAGSARFDEPGLDDLLASTSGRLTFHTAAPKEAAEASIIHVPTPSDQSAPGFSSALVEAAIASACKAALAADAQTWPHLIVVASTLMPGTFRDRLAPLVAKLSGGAGDRFVLSYVPDLVAIGDVIKGFRRPPALIMGADHPAAAEMTRGLYGRVVEPGVPHVSVTLAEAELSKVSWNFFFCMKIDYANLLARLAENLGGINVDKVVGFLSLDARIGRGFLKAGMPFGGPCLPRDVRAMLALCEREGESSALARAVADGNAAQLAHVVDLVAEAKPRSAGILGLAFKQGTGVTTLSPSFALIEQLVSRGIAVAAFDPTPAAGAALRRESWGGTVALAGSADQICEDCDVIVVAVDDERYGIIADVAGTDRKIIDPWGRVRGHHPGLIRPGRS